jgi:hypothetical protein
MQPGEKRAARSQIEFFDRLLGNRILVGYSLAACPRQVARGILANFKDTGLTTQETAQKRVYFCILSPVPCWASQEPSCTESRRNNRIEGN